MNIDDLLMFVRKTNPTMTKEKLMQELKKSKYSTIALCVVCKNSSEKK